GRLPLQSRRKRRQLERTERAGEGTPDHGAKGVPAIGGVAQPDAQRVPERRGSGDAKGVLLSGAGAVQIDEHHRTTRNVTFPEIAIWSVTPAPPMPGAS